MREGYGSCPVCLCVCPFSLFYLITLSGVKQEVSAATARKIKQKYVTGSAKTDHFAQISEIELLLPACSITFALYRSASGFAIVHTVPKLRASKCEHPKTGMWQKRQF